MIKPLLIGLALVSAVGCGKSTSPAAPSTPASSATRIINLLGGSVTIGSVPVGSNGSASFNIRNDGTSTLTVSSITGPCAGTSMLASWTSGPIPPASQQSVTVSFRPTIVQTCNGTLTVNGDQTSGTNTMPLTAVSTLDGVPLFVQRGTGDNVFTIPSYVTRVRVDATFSGSCQNFIAHLGASGLINVIIGTCSVADTRSPFSGTYAINNGGTVAITNSTGVTWTFTELR